MDALAAGREGGATAAEDVVFILAIFACVLAHEYGHVLMAQHYGVGMQGITLLPIGGLARLDNIPEEPRQSRTAFARSCTTHR